MAGPIRLGVVGYTSEWAAMMLYEAIFRYGLSNKFTIAAIAGREESAKDAMVRLLRKSGDTNHSLAMKLEGAEDWRVGKNLALVRNTSTLVEMLDNDLIRYFQITPSGTLPDEFYSPNENPLDAVGIYTANPYHLASFEDACNHGMNILLEKPSVPVIDTSGRADSADLDTLVRLNTNYSSRLILQDAEHYSAKRAAKTLFSNIWHMVSEFGEIESIKGEILEKDNPENPRTRALLRKENRTGLLSDTGVHLFSILTNLGYDIGEFNDAKYDIYPGYDIETYAQVKFDATHRLFNHSVNCEFTVAKFIDKMKTEYKPKKESKKINITFETGKMVTVDFREGTVESSDGQFCYSTNRPSFEYQTILEDFCNSIDRARNPRTSIANSIRNLRAIHNALSKCEVHKNLLEVYAR